MFTREIRHRKMNARPGEPLSALYGAHFPIIDVVTMIAKPIVPPTKKPVRL
jgi:hypothetical protein